MTPKQLRKKLVRMQVAALKLRGEAIEADSDMRAFGKSPNRGASYIRESANLCCLMAVGAIREFDDLYGNES